ncbi:MAG TPA: histidine kinase [Patescibacteria group bacterium]|nr:histidine kinase [Patescibacteria group bacterium]
MTGNLAKKIRDAFQTNVAGQQDFSWGEQVWLQLDPDSTAIQPTVSVAQILPGAEHPAHVHSGFAEILYGLNGSSRHWCDQREILLDAGKIGYISDGSTHRFVNHSPVPAAFISIVYSSIPKGLTDMATEADDVELAELAKCVNLEAIAEKFSQSVNMPVTLMDTQGQLLTREEHLPELCRLCVREQQGDCILSGGRQPAVAELNINCCRFGVAVIYSPILVKRHIAGYLGCGYSTMMLAVSRDDFPMDGEKKEHCWQAAYENLPFINRNQLTAAAETLSLVSTSLVQLMIDAQREKQLGLYQIRISEEREKQAQLQNALNQARLKFLESQINPHFLFNTLNTIAQRAEMEGSDTLASLTYSLASLLRLSLGKADSMVTVAEELDCVRDYLFIQETRFPGKFSVSTAINDELMTLRIPFMTIMVLIENAISHGFKNIRHPGKLQICGFRQGCRAVLEVSDNGDGISADVVRDIRELDGAEDDLPHLKGIGIKNLFLRLRHYYGDQFTLRIGVLPTGGTMARITLPWERDDTDDRRE